MNSINFRRIKGMERNFRRIFTFFQPVIPIVNGDRSSSPIIFKQVKPHNYNPGLKFVSLDLKVIFSARSRIKDCRFHRSPPRELSLISPPKIIPPSPFHEEKFGHGPISMNFSMNRWLEPIGHCFQADDFKINVTAPIPIRSPKLPPPLFQINRPDFQFLLIIKRSIVEQ